MPCVEPDLRTAAARETWQCHTGGGGGGRTGPSPHSSFIRLQSPFETGFGSVALRWSTGESRQEEGEGKKLGHSGALAGRGSIQRQQVQHHQ